MSSIFIYVYLNFKNCNLSICRGTSWTQLSIKINLFSRIADAFKLTLLTIFARSPIIDVWRALLCLWLVQTQAINCFPIHEEIKELWRHWKCELYQDIRSRLVFTTVFGIHCNFFIVLPIRLKTYRSNVVVVVVFFFVFFRAQARPIGNFSRPDRIRIFLLKVFNPF